MPLEIEIKLKLDTHDGVLVRLAALQARHVGRVRETNIFFDRADGALRRADAGLRVRLTTSADDLVPKALLTFKGPAAAGGLRSREAFDLAVTPQEQVVPLLRGLGFEQVLLFEKDRDTWRVGECLVELDTLPVFGCFLEIEGPSEEAVRGVQGVLGLSHMRQERKSYSQMVGEYLQQKASAQLRFGSD